MLRVLVVLVVVDVGVVDKMDKKVVIGIGALALVVMYFVFGGVSGNVVLEEGVQTVVIDMKDWKYSPDVINVEKDVPVRIYLSDNVVGCYRDLILPEMDMKKYFVSSEDYIEVTFPEGTYTFACSMYMGQGRIVAA
jgi:plastocyanin domain-containing protein